MKLQTFIKKNIKYLFMFIFFFLCLQFFYASFAGDQLYNYGFSYAISRGEIPYKDFNMVIPPVGAFVYAIPFLLFGHSLIVFNLFQSFLICLMFYFLFELYDKKAWLIFAVLMIPIPIPFVTTLFQGYNFLLVFEFVLLQYFIRNKKSDYLIGILLGVFVLTKQTVGLFMFFPSFYFLFKDRNKFFKRCIGFLIPCFIFLIYLLITGSFIQFWDLCLFGMFDFAGDNGKLKTVLCDFYFYLWIIEIVFLVFVFLKNKDNRNCFVGLFYLLSFSLIAVPLFDFLHVSYFSTVIVIYFLGNTRFNFKQKSLGINLYLFSAVVSCVWFLFMYNFKIPNIVTFNNFELFIMSDNKYNEVNYLVDYMRENRNTIVLSENSYLVKIILEYDIDYYDLLNYGNHGYDGTNKLIQRLDMENNKYILVDTKSYERQGDRQQFNKDVVGYVISNYDKFGELWYYDIYYKE